MFCPGEFRHHRVASEIRKLIRRHFVRELPHVLSRGISTPRSGVRIRTQTRRISIRRGVEHVSSLYVVPMWCHHCTSTWRADPFDLGDNVNLSSCGANTESRFDATLQANLVRAHSHGTEAFERTFCHASQI